MLLQEIEMEKKKMLTEMLSMKAIQKFLKEQNKNECSLNCSENDEWGAHMYIVTLSTNIENDTGNVTPANGGLKETSKPQTVINYVFWNGPPNGLRSARFSGAHDHANINLCQILLKIKYSAI